MYRCNTECMLLWLNGICRWGLNLNQKPSSANVLCAMCHVCLFPRLLGPTNKTSCFRGLWRKAPRPSNAQDPSYSATPSAVLMHGAHSMAHSTIIVKYTAIQHGGEGPRPRPRAAIMSPPPCGMGPAVRDAQATKPTCNMQQHAQAQEHAARLLSKEPRVNANRHVIYANSNCGCMYHIRPLKFRLMVNIAVAVMVEFAY